jgi:tetratricopeptide (TPR) repeat protein
VEPPIVSGIIPPLAMAHVPRSETGVSLAGLPPGVTLVLVPAEGTARTGTGGLGGTGKTHLAAVSAGMLRRDPALLLIVWVTATGRDAVVSGYAQALRDVGVRAPGANPEQAAAQFLAWLAGADQPWLVVLDDLRDRAVMDELWPRGPAGWVLVTTEAADTTAEVSNRHVVPVGPFSPREALACLSAQQYTDASQRAGALDLASDLDFQPVALGQAVAVMTELGTGCGEYRSRLAEHRQRTASPRTAGQQSALAAAWSASVEVAELLPPAGLAGRALALVSMLAPHGIPGAVLTSDAACEYLTGRPGGPTPQRAEASAAVYNLARAGLVSIDADSAASTVRVHPLVQAITREQLPAAESKPVALAAAEALAQAWSQPDVPPLVAQRLRDCTARLHELAGPLLWASDCHPALLQAGHSLDGSGMDGLAADYWRALLAISRQALGPRHTRTIVIRGRFAAACEASGLLPEAIAVYEQTLAELEQTLPASHPDIGAARSSLARAYRATDRHDDAVRLAREALADVRNMTGSEPDRLMALEGLARASLGAGQLSEAVEAYRRLLAGREQILGPDHPQTIAACSELAAACRASGQFKEAITLAKRALAACEGVLGTDHTDTFTARAALAMAYHGGKKAKTALALYERTLADRERVQGADHPDTINARGDLAAAYQSAGRLGSAVSEHEQTLAACERVFGPDHRLTRAARDDLNAAAAHAWAVRGIDLRSAGPRHGHR